MNNIITFLGLLKDEKERIEITNDLIKIDEYKIYYLKNNSSTKEMDMYIKDTVDKYRNNVLVQDYYNIRKEDENLEIDKYGILCKIEKMIYNYVLRKTAIEHNLKYKKEEV